LPTLRRAGHDEHYAIHSRRCTTCSHHCAYGRDQKGCSDVNPDSYSHAPRRAQGMVCGRGNLGSPCRIVTRGRHDHYRYGRPVHWVGVAWYGSYTDKRTHTTTTTSYTAKNGEPLRHRTTPYLISASDQEHSTITRTHESTRPPLMNYKRRRQGPIQRRSNIDTHADTEIRNR